MNQSTEINLIAKAIIAVQKELEPVPKDATNPHFKNRYASLDSITEYLRPILAKAGLAVVQGGGDMTNGGLMVTTTLIHESGQWISSSFEMPLEKGTPQAAGSCITYGRRYGLSAILALATEDDDDAQVASAPRQTKTDNPQRAPTPAPAGNEPECPKCGGKVWDNRLDKKNPRAPDFKCRDRSCDGVIWPPKKPPNPVAVDVPEEYEGVPF